ncbi:glycosyltransferase [Octadecabacter ascidiaceicola]|uniref:Glycosyl transferases group 1 n=1 Tax=Octadecabacter ascidiaceicola TaxID=1655543 RepID=A0A238JPV1_9RHOB|nr:glycosyltransferase [Octadecabacter ascidiaceicola]SMX32681.1 Glycosyl transferases group 1 [Octadecabacter ascidiaceicola]
MTSCHILLANVFFAPFTYGGATVVAEEVAKALLARKAAAYEYKITAVSLCCHSGLADYTVLKSEKDGIQNFVINVPSKRSYSELYDNPRVTALIGELMDDLQPDVVHVHCVQDMGGGVLEAAKDRGIPSILSVHDFWWLCERQFMIKPSQTYCGQNPIRIDGCRGCVSNYDAAQKRFTYLQDISRIPDRVTYPSKFAHDLYVSSGFASDRGVVWGNGVRLPAPDFAAKQTSRRKRDTRLTFGFVGGPSQIKGWPLIRAAFKSIGRSDFRVLLVDGSAEADWWTGETFADLPGDWEVYPRFEQSEMDGFYAELDVLLFMSQWKETFGLAVREAMARGVSLIQTDSGGSAEHGSAHVADLIPIGASPDVLKEAMIAALDRHPNFRPQHSVVDFDAQAAAFEVILQDVLEDAI